jgi:hypothetical protein
MPVLGDGWPSHILRMWPSRCYNLQRKHLQVHYYHQWNLKRSPLWSSGQSSWRCQIFWQVVGLEQGPLSLVSTTEEILGRNSRRCGLEIREYGRRDPSRWPRGTFYPQKLALTSWTSGGRTVGIVPSWTQATEFSCSSFSFSEMSRLRNGQPKALLWRCGLVHWLPFGLHTAKVILQINSC